MNMLRLCLSAVISLSLFLYGSLAAAQQTVKIGMSMPRSKVMVSK